MRAIRTSLFVSLLAFAFAPGSRADEPGNPLEKADRIEAEGRSMLEHGHRVEGAKTIAKAWQIRAEVWGAEQQQKKDEPHPEIVALKERIEQLKRASGEAEKAGHELKEAGKLDDAKAKMEESGHLWREAEEVQKKLEASALEQSLKDATAHLGREMQSNDLRAQAARAREEAVGAAADAKRAEAEGKEEEAKTALERAHRLRERVEMLETKIRGATQAKDAGPSPIAGLESEVKALHKQMDEMRAMLEDLRKRLGDQGK